MRLDGGDVSFLDEFESYTCADIQGFLEHGQSEHLHLEFKQVRDATLGGSEDRKNLAVAISGFANSAGGLIVWGVDARKDKDGIDRVVGLNPTNKLTQFIARLNSLTSEAVDPFAPGIKHRALDFGDDSGFAITLVPESDAGPHMAKLGENRYYKRNGDSFCKMEHFDVADMFGKRRRPKLSAYYSVTGILDQAAVHIGVKNTGRATARAPFFSFQTQGPLQRCAFGLDGNRNEGLPLLKGSRTAYEWTYAGGMDFALHPGMHHSIASISLGIPARPFPSEDIVVHLLIACEDQPLEHATLHIPLERLRGQ